MFKIRVLFSLFFLVLIFSQDTPLTILSVSGSPSAVQNPVLSSLLGGKMIYIKAIGHSPNPI